MRKRSLKVATIALLLAVAVGIITTLPIVYDHAFAAATGGLLSGVFFGISFGLVIGSEDS